jgi:hypothetical protein
LHINKFFAQRLKAELLLLFFSKIGFPCSLQSETLFGTSTHIKSTIRPLTGVCL